jgi:hypothetical protein
MFNYNWHSSKDELIPMRQDFFADAGFEKYRKKTRKEQFLEEIETIISWEELTETIEPFIQHQKGRVAVLSGLSACCEFISFSTGSTCPIPLSRRPCMTPVHCAS